MHSLVARSARFLHSLSHSRHVTLAVVLWSFLNPLLIPFPAESLLIPIALANRRRAIFLTALASVMTALGASVGYFLAAFLYDIFVAPFIAGLAVQEQMAAFTAAADPFAVLMIVFIAALTLIPDPPFIAAAGLLHISFPLFFVAFFIGRALRFALVIGIVLSFGAPAWNAIERLENRWGGAAAAALVALLIITFFFALRTLG